MTLTDSPGADAGPKAALRNRPKRKSRRLRLTDRDGAALADAYGFGALLRDQIMKRCGFGSVTRANARLGDLCAWSYLERVEFPPAMERALGTGCQAIYVLGKAGVPVVAARLGLDPTAVWRGVRRGAPTALWHALQAADFAVRLAETAARDPRIRLEPFLPERLCRHAYEVRETGGKWRIEEFKPDGLFFADAGAGPRGYAVEIDMGHASAGEFESKFAIHATYRDAGLFQSRHGLPFCATLVATTHPGRAQRLCALAEKAGNAAFWFTTFEAVEREGPFAAIWRAPFGTALRRLGE